MPMAMRLDSIVNTLSVKASVDQLSAHHHFSRHSKMELQQLDLVPEVLP